MIEQQGQVISQVGDTLHIRMGAQPGCSLCADGKGCGAGVFARLLGRKPLSIQLRSAISVQPGQAVSIGIPEKAFLMLLGRLYLLPLASGLCGAGFGHYLGVSWGLALPALDALTGLVAVASGCFALWLGRKSSFRLERRLNFKLLRIVPSAPAGITCPADGVERKYQR